MSALNHKTTREVATLLEISPTTLRRWTEEFANFLSSAAGAPAKGQKRRYTDEDLQVLGRVQSMMNQGSTYAEVRHFLENEAEQAETVVLTGDTLLEDDPEAILADDDLAAEDPADIDETAPPTTSLATADDVSVVAMAYLSETIDELRQGQISVLNSQAANRELIGVLIQDNFNLKEENARLRSRTLEMERKIGTIERDVQSRLDTIRRDFDGKVDRVTDMNRQQQQPITVLQQESRSGCLGALFGGGGGTVQAVAAPPAETPPATTPPQAAPPAPPHPPREDVAPPSYPKPPSPPE